MVPGLPRIPKPIPGEVSHLTMWNLCIEKVGFPDVQVLHPRKAVFAICVWLKKKSVSNWMCAVKPMLLKGHLYIC